MKHKILHTLSLCLLLCIEGIKAQMVNRSDTIITANTNYNKAGHIKRLFLGNHYRTEWATPVALKILNLDSVAGGLTPLKAGGGHQTKSLRLKGADGKEYVLRSVNKDPSKALPPEFVGTFAADVVQDQISSSNPYAAVVVAGLAEAAGIFHTTPEVVFVPASPNLGSFMKEFGNTICLFEERPSGNEENNAAFGGSKNIINSEKLFEKLLTDNNRHVDERAFLKARLFDMWIGDWDRHEDQWVWAAFKDRGETIYKPIPRDRDQAFAKLDGVLPFLAARKWAIRYTKDFDYTLNDVPGLNISASLLDRKFLTRLTLKDWIAVAVELEDNLTDNKIEDAFNHLPANIYDISAKEVIAKLKSRKKELITYAKEYYAFLAKEVNVLGTARNEFFQVERVNNDTTKVTVYKIGKDAKSSHILYQRDFKSSETKEIRLYGFAGNDQFRITGHSGKGILIRVVGGEGKDSVIDESAVEGRSMKTKVYDNDNQTFVTGDQLKKYISNDTLKNSYTKALLKYDLVAPKLAFGYNPDDGLYVGGGIVIQKQMFGKFPYGYMQSVWGNYAFETGAYNFWYEGIFREAIGKWDLHINAKVNAPNYVLNYYGPGNETQAAYEKSFYRVRSNQLIVSPSISRHLDPYQSIIVGLNYTSVKIERSESRFVTDAGAKLDTGVFSRKHFAGARLSYQLNTIDNVLYPTRGVKLNSGIEFNQNLKETKRGFTRVSSDISFFGSRKALTAAYRIGGAANFGNNYEFYQANTLGGTNNLRGYGRTRFAGKTSMYQNVELRYKLQYINGYVLKGNWGLLAFLDNGKVWIPNEKSDTWHFGCGGGIWFLPYNRMAFTASYGVSKEDKLLNIRADFLF